VLAISAASFAQFGVGVSITIAPPDLPVYEQPLCPGEDYIWTPGYWAYADDDYYWVPGTWIVAPEVGFLWTPGYWAFEENRYFFHEGYWGPHAQAAHANPQLQVSANQGKPSIAATPKPGQFSDRAVVPAREAGAVHNPLAGAGNNFVHNPSFGPENNAARPTTAIHPRDLHPVERPAAPNTGNVKQDQKYQQQQQKLQAKQDQERQKLQQKQDQDHQRLEQQKSNEAKKQQVEQHHQQQTQQLVQKHAQQQQQMQQRQQPAPHPSQPQKP
jgi:hypothetical protein